jgi:hypothetical protein
MFFDVIDFWKYNFFNNAKHGRTYIEYTRERERGGKLGGASEIHYRVLEGGLIETKILLFWKIPGSAR